MSKWQSETLMTKFPDVAWESREQLLAHHNTNLNAEETLTDRGTKLKIGLLSLSTPDRTTYFREIGVADPGDLEAWLTFTSEEMMGEDAALDASFNAANTLQELKAALIGRVRHRGRP